MRLWGVRLGLLAASLALVLAVAETALGGLRSGAFSPAPREET